MGLRRANRKARCQFLQPRRAAREHQNGHIAATDEEQESHGGKEHEQCPFELSEEPIVSVYTSTL
ncbi:MAG: hypothetical protein WA869_26225 [Alloacidobacterium sp.]|jgi:hypothetical protein